MSRERFQQCSISGKYYGDKNDSFDTGIKKQTTPFLHSCGKFV